MSCLVLSWHSDFFQRRALGTPAQAGFLASDNQPILDDYVQMLILFCETKRRQHVVKNVVLTLSILNVKKSCAADVIESAID